MCLTNEIRSRFLGLQNKTNGEAGIIHFDSEDPDEEEESFDDQVICQDSDKTHIKQYETPKKKFSIKPFNESAVKIKSFTVQKDD